MIKMPSVDVNVEYMHLYIGRTPSDRELLNAKKTANQMLHQLKSHGRTFSLCVLIDDYTEPCCPRALKEEALDLVATLQPEPTHIVWESSLVSPAMRLMRNLRSDLVVESPKGVTLQTFSNDLELIHREDERDSLATLLDSAVGSDRPDYSDQTSLVRRDETARLTCALLSATWLLVRLGLLPFDQVDDLSEGGPCSFVGSQLLTILPTHYIHIEHSALTILQSMHGKQFSKARRRIEYYFHQTRLLESLTLQ